MIDEKVLLQSRPEALNDKMDMELQNQKGGYNNGWNDCLFYFIDIIKRQQKVGEWIPFKMKDGFILCQIKTEDGFLNGQIPNVGEKILVTDGKRVWEDTWTEYDDGYALDSNYDLDEVTAWMPLPNPYKEKEND